jgi:hypothetical protein
MNATDNVNTFICVYCSQLLDVDDDAQRISRREVAHTVCAFAADAALLAALDAEKLLDEKEND